MARKKVREDDGKGSGHALAMSTRERLGLTAGRAPNRIAVARRLGAGGESSGAVEHREYDEWGARRETDAIGQGEVRL